MSIIKDDDQGALTKSDLIARLAAKNPHLTTKDVGRVVDTIFDAIANAMARGDRVEIRDFGTFSVRQREPRQGRNPRTGEAVSVVAKAIPFYKMGKKIRRQINGQGNE